MHAWNGTWGVIAVGLLAGQGLIFQSYGSNPEYSGDFSPASDQSNLSEAPTDFFRQYGCILGGNGRLLGAQIIYLMWLCGALPQASLLAAPVQRPEGRAARRAAVQAAMLGQWGQG